MIKLKSIRGISLALEDFEAVNYACHKGKKIIANCAIQWQIYVFQQQIDGYEIFMLAKAISFPILFFLYLFQLLVQKCQKRANITLECFGVYSVQSHIHT